MKSKTENLNKIFNFLHQAGKLKKILRYSAHDKMPKESVADHSWRLAIMAFIIAEELKLKINLIKALKIALVHDIAEAITGDIDYLLIYINKVSDKQKLEQEIKAMKKIKAILPAKEGKEIYKLWREYENGLSPEAKYIKALDKIEALTHIIEAGHKTYSDYSNPEIIPIYADRDVVNYQDLKIVLKIIKNKIKSEFAKGKIPWKKEYDKI